MILQENVAVAMFAAFVAVLVGVKIKEIGYRTFLLVMISAVLAAAAIIEAWFTDSTLMKSAAIGWIVGYLTDDVLLTFNTVLPNFIKEILDAVLQGIKKLVDKWFS